MFSPLSFCVTYSAMLQLHCTPIWFTVYSQVWMDIINTVKQTKAMWHEQNSSIFKRTANTFEPVSFESISGTAILIWCRAQWLRGRSLDFRPREPGFVSCAALLKPWAIIFTLYCSSSLSYINEYLAIDSRGYVYEQPWRINCSIWLDAREAEMVSEWTGLSGK